jgi:hypothetical protein
VPSPSVDAFAFAAASGKVIPSVVVPASAGGAVPVSIGFAASPVASASAVGEVVDPSGAPDAGGVSVEPLPGVPSPLILSTGSTFAGFAAAPPVVSAARVPLVASPPRVAEPSTGFPPPCYPG